MRASSAYSLFDTESVWAILMRIAPPVMLAQLIQAMYNIVDSYFVGQFSSDGLTALSIVYPIQLIVTAIAVGTGVGVNTLMSRYDGQGNHHLADRTAGTGTVLALISWLIFAVLSDLLMRPFAAISTESSSVTDLAVTYGTIVCVGSPGVFLESTWSKVHQARGNMRLPMLAQIAGAAANIVLDPILIFGMFGLPAMGVTGAAVATVTGQMTACGLAVFCFLRTRTGIRITRKDMKIDAGIAKRIYAVGVPSGLMTAMPSLLVSILNALLVGLHALAVAAFGLYFKLQTFVYMPANGLIQGMRPIVSYNYGAGQGRRLHLVIRWSLALTAIIMALGTLIAWGVPRQIMGLFDADEAMIAVGVPMLRITSLGFLVSTLGTVMAGCFEALGKGLYSLSISLLRQLLVIPPLAMVFSLSWGLNGVWAAFPVAETLAALVAVLLYRKVMQQTDRQLQNSEVDCAGGKCPGSRNS